MDNNEFEKRIALRIDTKNKNKTLSKIARRNGEDYQDVFMHINKTLFGDYFMAEFNDIYNSADPYSDRPFIRTKKSVLDYVDSICLEFYLDCINHIIYEVNTIGCTIKQALDELSPKAKIMLEVMHPNKVVLQKSIAYATKKRILELKKGICSTKQIFKEMHTASYKKLSLTDYVTNDEVLENQEDFLQQRRDYNSWKNSKEYKDYMLEERDSE